MRTEFNLSADHFPAVVFIAAVAAMCFALLSSNKAAAAELSTPMLAQTQIQSVQKMSPIVVLAKRLHKIS